MEEDENKIAAEFEYTAKDAALAGLWSFFRVRGIRIIYGILTAAGIAAAAAAVRGRETGARPLLFVLAFYVMLPTIVGVTAILNQRKMPPERRSNRYVFSADGVSIVNGVGQAQLSWPAFQRAVETRSAFYLSPQTGLWHFVPKRAFNSESDLDRARGLIASALGKQARVRRACGAAS